jgi:hypothetical protein
MLSGVFPDRSRITDEDHGVLFGSIRSSQRLEDDLRTNPTYITQRYPEDTHAPR